MAQSQAQFTAAHEQEMADFFSLATNPTEEPTRSADNTAMHTEPMSSKTHFRGVYLNTHSNKGSFKYRASISQWDDVAKRLFWINLGYFNCINVAGIAYNTSAFGIFLGSAKVNNVNVQDCDEKELAEFKTKRALRVQIAGLVMQSVANSGKQLSYIDPATE